MSASIYEEITNGIVESLENGVVPWVKPWATNGSDVPKNAHTGRPYSGINILQLWLSAMQHDFPIQQWLTFNQCKERGGKIIKGSKGTKVLFWKIAEREKDGKMEKSFVARSYTVFNVAQCEGIDIVQPVDVEFDWDMDTGVDDLVAHHKIDLRHGGDHAYFSPSHDYIRMPKRTQFPDSENYCATLFHEMTHWTGHKDRLNRKQRGTFGGPDYAKEELVAELGAAFMCSRMGIVGQLQHESYIKSWIQVLKDDKRAIFVASKLAEQAANYILDDAIDSEVQHDRQIA